MIGDVNKRTDDKSLIGDNTEKKKKRDDIYYILLVKMMMINSIGLFSG